MSEPKRSSATSRCSGTWPTLLKYWAISRAVKSPATTGKTTVKATTNCAAVDSMEAASIARHCLVFKNTSGTSGVSPANTAASQTCQENVTSNTFCSTNTTSGKTIGPVTEENQNVRNSEDRSFSSSVPSISFAQPTAATIAMAGNTGQI